MQIIPISSFLFFHLFQKVVNSLGVGDKPRPLCIPSLCSTMKLWPQAHLTFLYPFSWEILFEWIHGDCTCQVTQWQNLKLVRFLPARLPIPRMQPEAIHLIVIFTVFNFIKKVWQNLFWNVSLPVRIWAQLIESSFRSFARRAR